jgi:hypothetical protein
MTREGVILGTAAYMSPEQARGKPLDRRTDIWAFGCVLYELLTGRRAFGGESTTESLAAILRGEPDWGVLPPDTPPALGRLLRRCLAKEPERRLHDIADARLDLDEALEAPPATPVPPAAVRRPWLAFAVLLLLGVALGAGLWWRMGRAGPPDTWSGEVLGGPSVAFGPRLSPDGQLLGFLAMTDGLTQVSVMKPESGNWTLLTRDRSRGFVADLSWSRDGAKIYFDRFLGAPRGVYTVPVLGGAERLVLEDAMAPQELPDGSLLVARVNAERAYQLHRYWPETGRLEALAAAMVYGGWWSPLRVFPDGKEAVLFGRPLRSQENRLYALDLASGGLRELDTGQAANSPLDPPSLAVSPDNRSVVLALDSGGLNRILSASRDGAGPVTPLLSLTLAISYIDIGRADTLYVDQIDRSGEALRFPTSGAPPERVALPTLEGSPSDSALPLPDGRVLAAGRQRLVVAAWSQDPAPLLDTQEPTSGPVAMLGTDQLAFRVGAGTGRRIAIASLGEGRIVRRLQGVDATGIVSLAASRDGQTLYYSATGTVWSVPAVGGEPRKVHSGDSVSVDPRNGDLVISLQEKEGVKLVRVPQAGAEAQPIPITGDLRVAPVPLSSNAVGRDGRILVQFTAPHTWFWPAGVLDPASGRIEQIPVPYQGDMMKPGWDREGRVVTLSNPLRSTIWRFRRQ